MNLDASLCLNITTGPAVSTNRGKAKRPPKRKLTKYDKRRAQSAKAKQKVPPGATPSERPDRTNARTAKGDDKRDALLLAPPTDGPVDDSDASDDDTVEDGAMVALNRSQEDSDKSEDEVNEDDDADKNDEEEKNDDDENDNKNDDDENDEPVTPHQAVAHTPLGPADTTADLVSPSTTAAAQDHAAYLAEFHARPMELDRRWGAASRLPLQPATTSSHVFTHASWDTLQLHPRILQAIQVPHAPNGTRPTPLPLARPTWIQARAIPAIASSTTSTNFIVQSETGSGKTLAYLLPILHRLLDGNTSRTRAAFGTQCLVLCPTRELATQTLAVAQRLCQAVCHYIVPGVVGGGDDRHAEKARLRKGVGILVGTPGRLLDHLVRTASLPTALQHISWLVLDEADRLLADAGLGDQVRLVIQRVHDASIASGRSPSTQPWQSILVSATVNETIQQLAQETLSWNQRQTEWILIRGTDAGAASDPTVAMTDTGAEQDGGLAHSTPHQLIQLHVTVSVKLRLVTLVAFLVERVQLGQKTVVFLSTCAATDYIHALLTSMDSILPSTSTLAVTKGIFGSCPIYKLHGSVPQTERQSVLRQFIQAGSQAATNNAQGSILLATDVAARGLNLPLVDWIVQYDPPSDISDYVHRAGRVARAGTAGRSLLFLLPSEQEFVAVLKQRGVQSLSPMSLTTILNTAADVCSTLTNGGMARSSGGLGRSKGTTNSNSRSGEAFCSELQFRLEDCVVQDDLRVKAAAKAQMVAKKRAGGSKKNKGKDDDATKPIGGLLDLACQAFLSFIRAYPTKEKAIRHIFAAKALHLGHVARSLALKEPPKKLASGTKKRSTFQNDNAAEATSEEDFRAKRQKTMSFDLKNGGKKPSGTAHAKRGATKQQDSSTANARSLLMANAARLQKNGLDSM